jgi:hypothetical protein
VALDHSRRRRVRAAGTVVSVAYAEFHNGVLAVL